MKIAVIGASSFTGNAFCNYAIRNGDEVDRISRLSLDLSKSFDGDQITRLLECEAIFNFAALNMVAESWAYAAAYYRTNVVGVSALCDALANAQYIGRFIQISTPEVYGQRQDRITETDYFDPSTPYAISRAACDFHLRALSRQKRLRVIITRSCNVYGAMQQTYRLIPKTILKILRGEKLMMHGGGYSMRAWIHVTDAVSAIYEAAQDFTYPEYHITTDDYFSVQCVVDKICYRMGVLYNEVVTNAAERPGKDSCYQLRNTLSDWKPSIGFDDGLDNTISWYKRNVGRYADDTLEYIHRG